MTTSGADIPPYLSHVTNTPITPEYCAKLEGHLLAEFVFDRLLCKIAMAETENANGESVVLSALPEALRTFYHFRVADALIGNGGLWAYFELGEVQQYENETIEAFIAFGLKPVAKILQETAIVHKRENAKLEAAKKNGREEEFSEAYEYNAYDELESRLDKIDWDFDEQTERFLRTHLDELKE